MHCFKAGLYVDRQILHFARIQKQGYRTAGITNLPRAYIQMQNDGGLTQFFEEKNNIHLYKKLGYIEYGEHKL